MSEWEITYKVPVELKGTAYAYIIGYAKAENDEDQGATEPSSADRAAALKDARTGVEKIPPTKLGLDDLIVDSVKFDWDKAEEV